MSKSDFGLITDAWNLAGKDLGIDVVSSYQLQLNGIVYQYAALIKEFGSSKGTLIGPLDLGKEAVTGARGSGFFVSKLNIEIYKSYERQTFIDALNDWGYYGSASKCPPWYTGKP